MESLKKLIENIGRKTDVQRAQIVFLYDSIWDSPNGDPYTNQPRYDEATLRVLVSDVRIKRFVRDFMMMLNSKDIEIYSRELQESERDEARKGKEKVSGSSAMISLLSKKYGGLKSADDLLRKCFDVRAFGGISTAKDNTAQITGPIQFSMLNSSLNMVILRPHQNTSILPSDVGKDAGAIGTTSLVPFSLNQITGTVNPMLAIQSGLKEDEVQTILGAMWHSIESCETRSKQNQTPRLILKINMERVVDKINNIEEKIVIKEEDKDLRSFSQVTVDFSSLCEAVKDKKVKSIQYQVDSSLEESFLKQMAPVKSKLVRLDF